MLMLGSKAVTSYPFVQKPTTKAKLASYRSNGMTIVGRDTGAPTTSSYMDAFPQVAKADHQDVRTVNTSYGYTVMRKACT